MPTPLRGDAASITRMIVNLITNAIQHTPDNGAVVVEAGSRGGQAVVAVTDSCGGIPEGDLGRVFDVAWRGGPARTPGTDSGAGLGLAIVRGIAEAHSGTVAVRNVDHGCRFEICLPLTPAPPGAA
jgi:signal transduction histidine kinase